MPFLAEFFLPPEDLQMARSFSSAEEDFALDQRLNQQMIEQSVDYKVQVSYV